MVAAAKQLQPEMIDDRVIAVVEKPQAYLVYVEGRVVFMTLNFVNPAQCHFNTTWKALSRVC